MSFVSWCLRPSERRKRITRACFLNADQRNLNLQIAFEPYPPGWVRAANSASIAPDDPPEPADVKKLERGISPRGRRTIVVLSESAPWLWLKKAIAFAPVAVAVSH